MYSLLYIDDEPGLLEIGRLFLEQNGEFAVTCALSGDEALNLLQKNNFDAIVSDFQMPGMDGIEILKSVRASYGGIPFILFTGRGREEIVIAAINNGADFYLQKGGDPKAQFAELAHKIRQAIGRIYAEKALSDSEKRLADIIDFLPDATFAVDTSGKVIAWNRVMEEMTGVAAAKVLGKGNHEYALAFYGERRPMLIDLVFSPDSTFEKNHYTYTRHTPTTITAETVLGKDGQPAVSLWGTASGLFNDKGVLVGAIESIRDITELKKSEQELQAANEQLTASEEELRTQYIELAEDERRIRESEVRLRYLLGLFENAQKSEQDLFMAAIEGAGVMTGSPLGYLALVSDDESELLMYGWSQTAMTECGMQEKPLVYKTEKTGLWGEAVRQRQAVITNDYAAPNPKKKGYPPGHPQIIRHMNVPLMDGGHIVLVVGVANKPEEYKDHDVEELSLLMQGLWQVIKQKRAQAALQEEMTFSDAVLDSVPGLLYLYDDNGRLVRWNRNHELATGYSHDELAGWQLMDWFKGDEKSSALVSMGIKKAYEEGFADAEAELTTKDGTKIPYYFTAVRLDIGGKKYFTGVGIDISSRKKAEEEILRRQEQMEEITATVPGVVYLAHIKPGGSIEFPYVNVHAGEKIFGYDHTTTDFLGWFSSHVHADDRQKFLDSVGAAVSTGRDWYFEGRFIRPDGTLMWFQATSTAVVHDSELMYSGVLLDITPRKQAENAIREANRKLNLLTSITRHDMANQLTVVRGYAQMAVLKKPDPAVGDFITKIDSAVSVIQKQVEFMRTYQDLGVKAPSWFRIERLVHSARPASGPSVTCTCGTTEIFADPMINKVFSNLFDNAVRHGETVTEIQVSCEKAADKLIITVEDNGAGIPLNEKQKIFAKGFGRNTGFGLFLVREILAITGISIHETGRHGKGARFEITVPGGGCRSFFG